MPDRRPLQIADDLQSLPLPPEAVWIRARRPRRNWIAWAAAGSAALVVIAAAVSVRPAVGPTEEKDPGSLAAQPVATPEPSHELPSRCDIRVAVPARAASSVAWKADGQEIAITEVTNGRSEVVVLRGPDWQGRTLAEGSDPKWSASGTRIAFARGATIVIADVANGRELATITPAALGYGWSGDTLLYWGGSSLRGWRDGADARFGAHVPDLTPVTGQKVFSFSVDGSRYAVAGRDGKVLYGGTADGRVSPLPTFDRVRWSTGGANVLLTGGSATVLVRPEKRIFASATLPPRFALWSPDGSQALFGSDASPAAWDVIAWDGQKMGASVELESGLRSGAFSFDGGYLASIYDDGLRIYQCARDSATTSGLITRDQAKQVIQRSGALIKVNLEDSKLIRWADISGTLTGTWAVVQAEAAGLDPTTPVWLLMYAGEAKQPSGANFESSPGVHSPTVNLVFYVLDAKTGKQLGARVASGTWWIGQPFESLTDRAPDATPHPFERPQSSIPPIPTPRPTPSPVTRSAGAGLARVESAAGGWQ
ncbi:MAG TPA: WD40 repeat domain-containing protein, partial [Candidatus Limnocylindria bacterium]|nr:WD40 repeat domain-containing protein [Candidatus Limnocylindria bacterium]